MTTSGTSVATSCAISGGGPAGIMLGDSAHAMSPIGGVRPEHISRYVLQVPKNLEIKA